MAGVSTNERDGRPAPQERDGRRAQQELYGAPVADLTGRITAALQLNQGRLAQVLGLSAPMLSQLVSGHRVKIGNPAVVHRLQALLALADEAPRLTAEQIQGRLDAIRDEQATLTGTTTAPGTARAQALSVLAEAAEPADLEAAAAATSSPKLAALLREAARSPRG